MSQWVKKKIEQLDPNNTKKKEKSNFHESMKKLISEIKSKKESLAGVQTGFPSSVASFVTNAQLGELFPSNNKNKMKKKKLWFSKGSRRKKNQEEEEEEKDSVQSTDKVSLASESSIPRDPEHHAITQMDHGACCNSGNANDQNSVQEISQMEESEDVRKQLGRDSSFVADGLQIQSLQQQEYDAVTSFDSDLLPSSNPQQLATRRNLHDPVLKEGTCTCNVHGCSSKLPSPYRYVITGVIVMILLISVFVETKRAAVAVTVAVFLILRFGMINQGMDRERMFASIHALFEHFHLSGSRASETANGCLRFQRPVSVQKQIIESEQDLQLGKESKKQVLKKLCSIQRCSSFPPSSERVGGVISPLDKITFSRAHVIEDINVSEGSHGNELRKIGCSISLPDLEPLQELKQKSILGFVTGSSLVIVILAGLTVGRLNTILLATCWCFFIKLVLLLCECISKAGLSR